MEQHANCSECPKWHGNRHTEWGDCYHVVTHLEPKLFSVRNNMGHKFTAPFDPHSIKYYTRSAPFKKMYNAVKVMKLPQGIRRIFLNKSDVAFNEGEDMKPCRATVCFFQTRKDFSCQDVE